MLEHGLIDRLSPDTKCEIALYPYSGILVIHSKEKNLLSPPKAHLAKSRLSPNALPPKDPRWEASRLAKPEASISNFRSGFIVKDISDYLYALRNRGSSFGIERMERFSFLLGKPEESFPVVRVAGTNGKGSVCSMLDSIYRANGYKVGLFSSPHLVYLGERIRINGKITSMAEITRWVNELRPVAERMEEDQPGMHPTFLNL